jgi:hypothetical protein
LTSRQFACGQFQVSFEAMMNGSSIVVDGAGLNQEQPPHNSFFDVHLSSRTTPTDPRKTAAPTDPCRATFLLDPMAFETFDHDSDIANSDWSASRADTEPQRDRQCGARTLVMAAAGRRDSRAAVMETARGSLAKCL